MELIGEKIYLRAIQEQDSDVLLTMINDSKIEKNIGGWSFPVSEIEQINWIHNLKNQRDIFRCMIVDKKTDIAVGTAIISDIDMKNGTAEFHVKLVSTMQSKGFGKETIQLLINYCFEELRLNCLYANILGHNEKSANLFLKCGFVFEGRLRQRIFKNNKFSDILCYSIVRDDYNGNR